MYLGWEGGVIALLMEWELGTKEFERGDEGCKWNRNEGNLKGVMRDTSGNKGEFVHPLVNSLILF